MRISDWSSDVCSSDLHQQRNLAGVGALLLQGKLGGDRGESRIVAQLVVETVEDLAGAFNVAAGQVAGNEAGERLGILGIVLQHLREAGGRGFSVAGLSLTLGLLERLLSWAGPAPRVPRLSPP